MEWSLDKFPADVLDKEIRPKLALGAIHRQFLTSKSHREEFSFAWVHKQFLALFPKCAEALQHAMDATNSQVDQRAVQSSYSLYGRFWRDAYERYIVPAMLDPVYYSKDAIALPHRSPFEDLPCETVQDRLVRDLQRMSRSRIPTNGWYGGAGELGQGHPERLADRLVPRDSYHLRDLGLVYRKIQRAIATSVADALGAARTSQPVARCGMQYQRTSDFHPQMEIVAISKSELLHTAVYMFIMRACYGILEEGSTWSDWVQSNNRRQQWSVLRDNLEDALIRAKRSANDARWDGKPMIFENPKDQILHEFWTASRNIFDEYVRFCVSLVESYKKEVEHSTGLSGLDALETALTQSNCRFFYL
jgi:hypothetical protein